MQKHARSRHLYDQQGYRQSRVWEKEKTQKQLRRFFRIMVVGFLFLVLLTILVQIPSIVSHLQKPFPNIQNEFAKRGDVNLQHRTNILLITESDGKMTELGFISLFKGDRKIRLFKLDPKIEVAVLLSSGNLNQLAFDKGKLNIDRLEESLIESYGYFFDGYIVVEDKINWINNDSLEKLIDNFYSPGFFLNLKKNKDYLDKKLKTNLTLNQTTNLIWFSKNLTPDRVESVDLSASKTADNFVDQSSVENKVGLLLTDSNISNESAAVEIENSSRVSGVGSILKELITNLGGNVLSISKGDQDQKKSRLIVKDRNSVLAKRLATIVDIKLEMLKKGDNQEGDIKLIIGDDFASFFDF